MYSFLSFQLLVRPPDKYIAEQKTTLTISRFVGFIPSCLITLTPSIKNTRIKATGNKATPPTAKTNITFSIPITKSCASSHSENLYKANNENIAKHIIIIKNEAPLHNALESCSIIPANMHTETKNTKMQTAT